MGIVREGSANTSSRSQLPLELQALVDVHQSVWMRITQGSSVGVQKRFASYVHDYLEGSREQVCFRSQRRYPSFDDLLDMRRKSAGVAPLFALAEYALKLDIPEEVFQSKAVREIQQIGVDFVVISFSLETSQNDILSYCKEETEGVPHNLVVLTRYQMECSNDPLRAHPQAAFDRVGGLLTKLYQRWFLALSTLPSWGERVDADVQRYIASVRAIVAANLNWRSSG
ncbi:hypothetical protein UA08_03139 [Talaromyces atroroseus]|uniref:Terpene synthase n=1 Tax=Talaromyces atroroseus TaxID=1441469 RepID=A0A225AVU7_TALAT|nr:hypothetical protein UA08_03139 [Talaromyces atroroseus]OKL61428.1 hypothetical protein UA08_03139 [Talaromyces atroroseus]